MKTKMVSQITKELLYRCPVLLIISIGFSPLNYFRPGLSSFMHILRLKTATV